MWGLPRKECTPKRASSNRAEHKTELTSQNTITTEVMFSRSKVPYVPCEHLQLVYGSVKYFLERNVQPTQIESTQVMLDSLTHKWMKSISSYFTFWSEWNLKRTSISSQASTWRKYVGTSLTVETNAVTSSQGSNMMPTARLHMWTLETKRLPLIKREQL